MEHFFEITTLLLQCSAIDPHNHARGCCWLGRWARQMQLVGDVGDRTTIARLHRLDPQIWGDSMAHGGAPIPSVQRHGPPLWVTHWSGLSGNIETHWSSIDIGPV